jgi:hypothetical protein
MKIHNNNNNNNNNMSNSKKQIQILKTQSMENFRRGLHSYLGASAKTSLGVCATELKH